MATRVLVRRESTFDGSDCPYSVKAMSRTHYSFPFFIDLGPLGCYY
jgi:hypothetical protein